MLSNALPDALGVGEERRQKISGGRLGPSCGFASICSSTSATPAMTSRAVVLVLRVQLLEEPCDVHAGAVREVLGLVPVRGVVMTHVAHNQVIEGFEVAALELRGSWSQATRRAIGAPG